MAIRLEYLSPSWMILSEGFRKSRLLLAAKRNGDVFVSLVLLLVTLPIMGIVALTIWLESGSPISFFGKNASDLAGARFNPEVSLDETECRRTMVQSGPPTAISGLRRVGRIIANCASTNFHRP